MHSIHINDNVAKKNDPIFKKLDALYRKLQEFKKEFNKLSPEQQEFYTKTVNSNTQIMYCILNSIETGKAINKFIDLLQKDKYFAFDTLNNMDSCTLFKTLFDKLDKDQDGYIKHAQDKKHATAMSRILNVTKRDKAINKFIALLQKDKDFAFNTLGCISPSCTLFKTLFDKLDKDQDGYIKHIQGKKHTTAMFGVLNVMERAEAIDKFIDLLKKDKDYAFNTLDCINFERTLLRTLFDELDTQQKNDYRRHLESKKTGKAKLILSKLYSNNERGSENAISNVSNVNILKEAIIASGISTETLEANANPAMETVDSTIQEEHALSSSGGELSLLDQDKDGYIEHIQGKKHAKAMSRILKMKTDEAIDKFIDLLQKDKDFAFNTLDCITPSCTLFKTLFDKLDKDQDGYIKHIQGKKHTTAMFGVLNAMKIAEAIDEFIDLLQKDKDYAFNTLYCIDFYRTLLRTLFDKLDTQQKGDYRQHLERKKTGRAKLILSKLYSHNARGSENAISNGSNVDTLKEAIIASGISTETLEANTNPVMETVDSTIQEEHALSSSGSELSLQDIMLFAEKLEDKLPDELINPIENQHTSLAVLDEFHSVSNCKGQLIR